MNTQTALPVKVDFDAIARKKSFGDSIELCAEFAGYELDKTLQLKIDVDKGQFSRWKSGGEGVMWPKLNTVMDVCGNDAPVFWMLHRRGWDLASLRRHESETERELRLTREQLAAEKNKVRILTDAMNGRAA